MVNKIILINPKTGLDIGGSLSPPAGILALAAELDAYDIKIIDQRFDKNWFGVLKKEIKNDPLCVGISSICGQQIKNGLIISEFVKKYDKNIPIIWGGVHPTLFPQQTLENEYIDFVVRGEGEITFKELINLFEKNKTDFHKVRGLSYKGNNKIRHNSDRPFLDMDNLKSTSWSLIDVDKYIHKNTFLKGSLRELDIGMTTRGCTFNCGFCISHAFNKGKWRAMSAEKTVKKIVEDVNQFNLDAVWLRDDNFFLDLKRVEKIAKLLKKEKLDIHWYTSGIRIDTFSRMSDGLISKLDKSGCNSFRFGVESGSDRILNLIGKNITTKDVLNVNTRIAKKNIVPYYSFMCGLPTETKEDVLQTVKLTNRLRKDNLKAKIVCFTMYIPIPNTKLFDLHLKKDLKLPETLEEWSNIDHFSSITKYHELPYIKKKDLKFMKNVINTSIITSEMVWDILPFHFKMGLYPMKKWAKLRWDSLSFRFMPEIDAWTYLSNMFLKF